MAFGAYPKLDKENPEYGRVYEEIEKIVREEDGDDRLDIEKFMGKIAHEVKANSELNGRGKKFNVRMVSVANEIPERLVRDICDLAVEEEER